MDITPQADSQQATSDDQELAKALAGVMPDVPEPATATPAPEGAMDYQETPVSTPAAVPPVPQPNVAADNSASSLPQPVVASPTAVAVSSELDVIKKDALVELRPLIDKVQLPPEEKFDTYLMLIRSTDDSSLIGPAHQAAQSITDETRRAEALLEIIKEINYLSHSEQSKA